MDSKWRSCWNVSMHRPLVVWHPFRTYSTFNVTDRFRLWETFPIPGRVRQYFSQRFSIGCRWGKWWEALWSPLGWVEALQGLVWWVRLKLSSNQSIIHRDSENDRITFQKFETCEKVFNHLLWATNDPREMIHFEMSVVWRVFQEHYIILSEAILSSVPSADNFPISFYSMCILYFPSPTSFQPQSWLLSYSLLFVTWKHVKWRDVVFVSAPGWCFVSLEITPSFIEIISHLLVVLQYVFCLGFSFSSLRINPSDISGCILSLPLFHFALVSPQGLNQSLHSSFFIN